MSINTLRGAQKRRSDDETAEETQARAKELADLQTIKARIDKQVGRLVSIEEDKGCLDAVATYDRNAVRQRAEFGRLTTERAIQRARADKLLSVEDAKLGCSALTNLREVDLKALKELENEYNRARANSAAAEELDSLFVVKQNLRSQLSKADTRLESFCGGMEDLAAGTM